MANASIHKNFVSEAFKRHRINPHSFGKMAGIDVDSVKDFLNGHITPENVSMIQSIQHPLKGISLFTWNGITRQELWDLMRKRGLSFSVVWRLSGRKRKETVRNWVWRNGNPDDVLSITKAEWSALNSSLR